MQIRIYIYFYTTPSPKPPTPHMIVSAPARVSWAGRGDGQMAVGEPA